MFALPMNDRFIEDVKQRVDLVELVRKHVPTMKKSGKNYMCKSPFRNEKTPSFSISPEKQMWYDFGAGEGGDTVSFVEKIENCSFLEAVELLADQAGLEVPKDFGNKGISRDEKKDIFRLHQKACEFFAQSLQKSKEALKYAKDRGMPEGMIEDWQLGFGGMDKDGLTTHLFKAGFTQAQIAQSGVAFERSFGDKSMMDRFWGRFMIPIREPKNGEIIAFSGREILGREKTAKYVNSPENPVYHKSATLFGLDRARKAIKDQDKIVLVEGNFDVVFAHHYGLNTTVATCGTALTEDHLLTIKRLTPNVYLAFDNDLAGKKATLKGVEMCLKMDLNPYVVALEGVKDMGEFLEDKENAKRLHKVINGSQGALDFLFDRFGDRHLDGTLDGQKRFLDAFFYFLNLVQRPIEVDDFLTRIGSKIGRPKSIIEAEFKKFGKSKQNYIKPKFVEEKAIRFTREECFVGFLFSHLDFFVKTLEKQAEPLSNLLKELPVRSVFVRALENRENLSPEEEKNLLAWEMHAANLYDELSPEALKKEFRTFVDQLQSSQHKQQGVEQGVAAALEKIKAMRSKTQS